MHFLKLIWVDACRQYRIQVQICRKLSQKIIKQIKGKSYQKIGVHFTSENGGVDYQDTFRYWFDEQTKTLDYLAYEYLTDAGGIRFRVAINRRTIAGVLFQDYENYKAPKNTPLDDLPKMYEKGELVLLSRIANDSITLLKP